MSAFRYEAFDTAGRVVSGLLEADTPRHARTQLRARGLFPSTVAPASGAGTTAREVRRIRPAELSLLTRQMATLLQSGLTVERTLGALIDQAGDVPARDVLTVVRSDVVAGVSLAAALGAHARSFPDYYVALVDAGEQAGALATVLRHLADHLDARQAIRQRTGLALLYPALVSGVAALIVAGLLVYVVPQVVQVFQHARQELPWLTRALIALSAFLRGAAPYAVLAGAAAVAAGFFARRHAVIRLRVDGLLLRVPGVGNLLRSSDTARFAGVVGLLVGGGVPLLAALESGARVMSNSALREAVHDVAARVRDGAALAFALAASGAFPPLLLHLVANGEATGQLPGMLDQASRLEMQAVERRLGVLLALLEPALILLMGGVVLLIVLAVLLPIIEMNQLVR